VGFLARPLPRAYISADFLHPCPERLHDYGKGGRQEYQQENSLPSSVGEKINAKKS
jgi:hypothetical protein